MSSKRLFVQPLQCNSLLRASSLAELNALCLSLPIPFPAPNYLQLVLETYNVPELSAGVNCTFEDLSEMDGLVVGNQIQCISPAAKEVPRIVTENGECATPSPPVLPIFPSTCSRDPSVAKGLGKTLQACAKKLGLSCCNTVTRWWLRAATH